MKHKIDVEHVEEKLKQHIILNRDQHSFLHVEWIYLRNSLDEIIELREKLELATKALEKIADPIIFESNSIAVAVLKEIK